MKASWFEQLRRRMYRGPAATAVMVVAAALATAAPAWSVPGSTVGSPQLDQLLTDMCGLIKPKLIPVHVTGGSQCRADLPAHITHPALGPGILYSAKWSGSVDFIANAENGVLRVRVEVFAEPGAVGWVKGTGSRSGLLAGRIHGKSYYGYENETTGCRHVYFGIGNDLLGVDLCAATSDTSLSTDGFSPVIRAIAMQLLNTLGR